MMTILITGGGGFVGSHVVAALARRFPGSPVIVADLIPPSPALLAFWRNQPVSFRFLDMASRSAVHALISEVRPRYVVHAAAITPTPEMEAADPVRIIDVNLGGTLSLLDAATQVQGIARIVVFSSAAVYGFDKPLSARIDEDTALSPNGLYAVSKAAAEGLTKRFGELRGVSTAAVRVGACYGVMERPTNHRARMSQVYPLFRALADGRPITVATSAALRDWTDADDVGDAVAALLDAPKLSHAVYNVGSGMGYRWSDVLALFARHGLDLRLVEAHVAEASLEEALSRPPMAIDRLVADTGFSPHRTLEDAILRVLASREGF